MQMIVEFDISADLIEVPAYVVENRELLRSRFFKWLYGYEGSKRYRKGGCYCYRSDAFVEWLNKKILKNGEQAKVLEVEIRDWEETLPSIFF